MKIFYVRHAKTNNNVENNKKWQGLTDVEISDEGRLELNDLKDNIKIDFDIIYCSPLKRARETAEAIKKNGLIIHDNRIIERNFGDLELTEVNYEEMEAISNWDLNTDLNKNVEKVQDMYNRLKLFLHELKEKYSDSNKQICIVSHSWVGRLLFYYASQERDTSIIKTAPKHTTLYELEI